MFFAQFFKTKRETEVLLGALARTRVRHESLAEHAAGTLAAVAPGALAPEHAARALHALARLRIRDWRLADRVCFALC